jgi:cellulose synthase/poly-beta-1,6-N-acetylglucosamine synthase-like glycosyltransferase
MIVLILGFLRLPVFNAEDIPVVTRFSIVIPFRNEAEHLPKLLESLQRLQYPSEMFEIIFVNDASTDSSTEIIRDQLHFSSKQINFSILDNERNSASPKKDAITAAVALAKNDWILTTDADCVLPERWLHSYDAYIQKFQPTIVGGPVRYEAKRNLAEQFQKFDSLSLQLVTLGSFGLKIPLLCNGANLGYKKEAFNLVNGFKDNDHIASGDDVFILEKMQARFPGQTGFLKSKDAIVGTQPQKNWPEVINQRIRWASKTSNQNNTAVKMLGGLVFLVNLFILITAIYCLFRPEYWVYFLVFLFLKLLCDFIAIRLSSHFFGDNLNLSAFFLSLCCYPLVIVSVVISSFRGNYHWKGRKFEKTT